MTDDMSAHHVFVVCSPGLEHVLANEMREAGFDPTDVVVGGVSFEGSWADVVRANRDLRGATRILVRVSEFRALHLAQLDKRARKVEWANWLRADVPLKVEATCRKSKIYHAGAARQRIERAISDTLGAEISDKAEVVVKARIFDDLCTISLDTSGEALHKRGTKTATGKAPIRETLAALLLRSCGYSGQEPVLDPMCGSGTFLLEAADWATGRPAGRHRNFAFEHMVPGTKPLKTEALDRSCLPRFYGSDRDQGGIDGAKRNAEAADVSDMIEFSVTPISALERPDEPPGLVIVNPPYGGRIGNRKQLFGLYAKLGTVLTSRFKGWRVGLVTSDHGLAKATDLPFKPVAAPIDNGGIKVHLFQTDPLA